MKNALVLILIFVASVNAKATHYIGGHITYKAKDLYEYQIIVTTYTDSRSVEADRPIIEVDFGDGQTETVSRFSQKLISSFVQENIFITTHNYKNSGTGNYIISFTDANRTSEILNADQSVSQPFYLESLLVIDSAFCANSSARFSVPPVFNASMNATVYQSLNTIDENGDSLVFELVAPLQNHGKAVNGFTFPRGLKLNQSDLAWQPDNVSGKYLIALKISEYRNNKLAGYTIKEWITNLVASEKPVEILSPCNSKDSSVCVYDGRNSNHVNFKISAPGSSMAEANIVMFTPAEIDFGNNAPVFNVTQDSAGNIVGEFSWKPGTKEFSEKILNFVFTITKSGNLALQNHLPVKILVNNKAPEPCKNSSLSVSEKNENEQFIIYPNPFRTSATMLIPSAYSNLTCIIYNIQGQKVAEIAADYNLFEFDGLKLGAGLYLYHISNAEKMLGHGKFVVLD